MISLAHLRAFSSELQKNAGLRDTVKGVAGAAKERVKKVVEGATAAAAQKGEEVGAAVGKGMSGHAEEVGSSIGKGMADHAGPTGRDIGRGIAEHLSEGGGRLVDGGIDAVKRFAKKRSVQAGGAALGATFIGAKSYGVMQQHKRDKTQESIAKSLRRLPKKQETA